MKFIVLFEDNPSTGSDVRARLMPEHLKFLKRNSAKVESAGPLKAGDGLPAGGLWIVEADCTVTVQQLVEEDTFWPTGLRKSVSILAWTQVFVKGRALINA